MSAVGKGKSIMIGDTPYGTTFQFRVKTDMYEYVKTITKKYGLDSTSILVQRATDYLYEVELPPTKEWYTSCGYEKVVTSRLLGYRYANLVTFLRESYGVGASLPAAVRELFAYNQKNEILDQPSTFEFLGFNPYVVMDYEKAKNLHRHYMRPLRQWTNSEKNMAYYQLWAPILEAVNKQIESAATGNDLELEDQYIQIYKDLCIKITDGQLDTSTTDTIHQLAGLWTDLQKKMTTLQKETQEMILSQAISVLLRENTSDKAIYQVIEKDFGVDSKETAQNILTDMKQTGKPKKRKMTKK